MKKIAGCMAALLALAVLTGASSLTKSTEEELRSFVKNAIIIRETLKRAGQIAMVNDENKNRDFIVALVRDAVMKRGCSVTMFSYYTDNDPPVNARDLAKKYFDGKIDERSEIVSVETEISIPAIGNIRKERKGQVIELTLYVRNEAEKGKGVKYRRKISGRIDVEEHEMGKYLIYFANEKAADYFTASMQALSNPDVCGRIMKLGEKMEQGYERKLTKEVRAELMQKEPALFE